MPISGKTFCDILGQYGYHFYTGVPCSYFKDVITEAETGTASTYVGAANEGAALAVAAGASEAGQKPAVLLQNSGFGNLVNPLTSLSLIYCIPTLLFISVRAYPSGVEDEPQHRVIGATMPQLLDAFEVPYATMPGEPRAFEAAIAKADRHVQAGGVSALLIQKGMIGGDSPGGPAASDGSARMPLSRSEAIEIVAHRISADTAVVASTGKIARELFSTADRAGNFYMQGSMGHAAAIGLGVAVSVPNRPVVILDGDGAALMHMGTMATIGESAPPNLVHVILDNEAYGTTGNQTTSSATTRLDHVALACGYRRAVTCHDGDGVRAALAQASAEPGPTCVLVKVNRREPPDTPRVTSRYTPEDNTRSFSRFITNG